jgi:hypothetical protein
MYGFRDEAALYDNTFQQYGQIFVMNADGSGKRLLTDSRWEDAMPLYIPAASQGFGRSLGPAPGSGPAARRAQMRGD